MIVKVVLPDVVHVAVADTSCGGDVVVVDLCVVDCYCVGVGCVVLCGTTVVVVYVGCVVGDVDGGVVGVVVVEDARMCVLCSGCAFADGYGDTRICVLCSWLCICWWVRMNVMYNGIDCLFVLVLLLVLVSVLVSDVVLFVLCVVYMLCVLLLVFLLVIVVFVLLVTLSLIVLIGCWRWL